MTYPEAQTSLEESKVILQGITNRTETLTTDVAAAVGQQDGLFGQIPPPPFGGYTEEPSEEFIAQVDAWAALALSLNARIPA